MDYGNFKNGDSIGIIDCDACRDMLNKDDELKRVKSKEEFEELRNILKEIEELCYACMSREN